MKFRPSTHTKETKRKKFTKKTEKSFSIKLKEFNLGSEQINHTSYTLTHLLIYSYIVRFTGQLTCDANKSPI